MIQKTIFFLLCLIGMNCYSQYHFEGQIADNVNENTIYLSLIEDYRKLSRPYLEQVIKKTTVDSLGFFHFKGDNLSTANRIYRIHIDECSNNESNATHFFGRCTNSRSILFIANNYDSISFPTTFADEVLCEVSSTNTKSSAFLEIAVLKEEMAFDFYDFPSVASQKLNSKKWFSTLQDFGKKLKEPLVELYIYDFLSDKRSETYAHYLKDISSNPYYVELGDRLQTKYPNTIFTDLYHKEIAIDQQMVSPTKTTNLNWLWGIIIGLSMTLNMYFLIRQRNTKKKHKSKAFNSLTAQEQKIVNEILQDKTNKEIATDLFITLSTVKTHINNVYKKLNVTSRDEIKENFS